MKIRLLNKIAAKGLAALPETYTCGEDIKDADAILVRSAVMHDMIFNPELDAIARCGAGVNNIPLDRCADEGIVVFNTPGANANAVKELTVCALLLASRNVIGGVAYANSLTADVAKTVEKGKSAFGGCEIAGKTLGIIGLGAIGRLVAEAAGALGMHVVGCDPFLSPERRDTLPPMDVVNTFDEVFAAADYLTLHVPATPETRGLISAASIAGMKPGVRLLNLARADLAVAADVKEALVSGKVAVYVTDFPTEETVGVPGIIAIPHLGASTEESEDNCAVMAADEIRDYLENGTIRCSVNFPAAEAPRRGGRIVVLGRAGAALGEKIGAAVSAGAVVTPFEGGTTAVVYADYEGDVPEGDAEAIAAIDGVCRVRELF